MTDKTTAPVLGWRSYKPSTANVSHIMNGGDAVCGAKVALTTSVIEATPRAFPPTTLAKLSRLPSCGACARRIKRDTFPAGLRKRRQRIEELEAALRRIVALSLPEASEIAASALGGTE